ncbi:MAG: hypothetical protein QOD56_595 [Gammaproteobacteria bacterium]|nr:hypothetical protein [Gammaproteobacteria bacterium]
MGAFASGRFLSTVYIRFTTQASHGLQRAPLLERLIARAYPFEPVGDWRGEAFRVIADERESPPSIAAAALYGSFGAMPAAWVCIATPVHLIAGMSNVTMEDEGVLALTLEEALALAADFDRVFSGVGARLLASPAGGLLCVFDRRFDVETRDPEALVGGDVFGFQPVGADAASLRRLMSEMEMWLFDHAVNRARAARASLPITGLWLWGGGPALAAMPRVRGWTAGRDPLFGAFGARATYPDDAGAGVVVCRDEPGSNGWLEVEHHWLAPAMAALRTGRIVRLELSAGARRWAVGRRSAWRFWRRPRPWWEAFERQGSVSNGIQ